MPAKIPLVQVNAPQALRSRALCSALVAKSLESIYLSPKAATSQALTSRKGLKGTLRSSLDLRAAWARAGVYLASWERACDRVLHCSVNGNVRAAEHGVHRSTPMRL